MKILLIAGHGEGDPGACTNIYKEETLTREAVSIIQNRLNKYAKTDVFDVNKNMYKYLKNNSFNFKNYDYVLEVHFNAGASDVVGNGKTTGCEILVHNLEKGVGVEENILSCLESFGFKKRGIKRSSSFQNMNICKGKQGVSYALLEMCFIDDADDMKLYNSKKNDINIAVADAIAKGFSISAGSKTTAEKTVMKLPDEVYVQEINPKDFKIEVVDKKKKDIENPNFFNLGYFTYEGKGNSISVGNLASGGKILANSKNQANWINVSKKSLTTIYTTKDGECGILKTDDLSKIKNLNTAVSGIPIIINSKYVPIEDIRKEGYFGTELYNTWHSFLGIRHKKLVYVAMKCDFNKMCWALVALGIYNAIKLDGGGSFILKNGEIIKSTDENRRIHNIGVWI